MHLRRTTRCAFAAALAVLAACQIGVTRAAEFLYDNGVIFSGTTNAILRIHDTAPSPVVAYEPVTVDQDGSIISVYVKVTLSSVSGPAELLAGADLGAMPEAKQFTVNYYLATRTTGGAYGEFQLRKSEPLVIITVDEARPTGELRWRRQSQKGRPPLPSRLGKEGPSPCMPEEERPVAPRKKI